MTYFIQATYTGGTVQMQRYSHEEMVEIFTAEHRKTLADGYQIRLSNGMRCVDLQAYFKRSEG
jgi:hypothetical protein